MRHLPLSRCLALTLLCALSACQLAGPGAPRPRTASPKAASETSAPVVTAATPVTASPSPAASLKPSPAASDDLLKAPAGPSQTLSGTLALDAAYMVASGAGAIISQNSGAIISAGGGNIISQNGGSIIAGGGGNVIAAGAGNIISGGGGNIISGGGGNIISGGGGNIISGGGGNYRLLADAAAPPAGTLLKAAGMQVSVQDLRTGEALPVGEDSLGKPVYGVYTNSEGAYTLYLPKAQVANVRLVLRVPGGTDPRLGYDLLASPGAAIAQNVDEDSALVHGYLHVGYQIRMEKVLRAIVAVPAVSNLEIVKKFYPNPDRVPEALVALFDGPLERLRREVASAGVTADTAADAAHRGADALLAHMDLSGVTVDVSYPGAPKDMTGQELALPVMQEVIKAVREHAAAKMQGASAPYFADSPTFKPFGFTVQKASDVPAFVVSHYFAEEDAKVTVQPRNLLVEMGFSASEADRQLNRAGVANFGIWNAIVKAFSDEAALDDLYESLGRGPKTP